MYILQWPGYWKKLHLHPAGQNQISTATIFFPPMHAHCDILYNAATSLEEYFLIWPIHTFFNFSVIQTLNWIILGTTTHMYRKFTTLHWYHIDSAG